MTEAVRLQQTFDTVVRHLRRQGRPSVRSDRAQRKYGAYRGTGGCMCSAGCLIPDSMYSPAMEGRAAADDQLAGIAIASLGHNLELVLQLQVLHDALIETWSPIGVSVGFAQLAVGFGLDPAATTEPL